MAALASSTAIRSLLYREIRALRIDDGASEVQKIVIMRALLAS